MLLITNMRIMSTNIFYMDTNTVDLLFSFIMCLINCHFYTLGVLF